jgi:hypothetical protein
MLMYLVFYIYLETSFIIDMYYTFGIYTPLKTIIFSINKNLI